MRGEGVKVSNLYIYYYSQNKILILEKQNILCNICEVLVVVVVENSVYVYAELVQNRNMKKKAQFVYAKRNNENNQMNMFTCVRGNKLHI